MASVAFIEANSISCWVAILDLDTRIRPLKFIRYFIEGEIAPLLFKGKVQCAIL